MKIKKNLSRRLFYENRSYKSAENYRIFVQRKGRNDSRSRHNTDLKKRLAAYAEKFPTECRLLDDDPELGCKEFEIAKGRLPFRLTEPYSEERRQKASEYAKKNGLKGR